MVTMVLLNVAWICTIPTCTMRFSFFLKLFFLVGFAAAAFAILCLCRRLLLVCYRAPARSLAGTRVGMRSLSAHRQAAAMAQAAIGAHFDVPLDVHRNFLAQIAFDGALLFQDLTDFVHFLFRQVADLFVEFNAGPVEQAARARPAYAVNVGQADFGSLFGR